MNKKRGILLSLLAAVVFTMLFSMNTFAATRYMSLKAGKVTTDKKSQKGDRSYFKITVPKNGYLTITSYAQYRGSGRSKYGQEIQLCNSKKKLIKNTKVYTSSMDKYVVYYGVKKGTYFVRVDNTYTNADVKIKYTFKAVTEKSGSSKAKAVSISKGRTKTGLLQAGEKNSKIDYYKIKLTKSQVLNITLNTRATGYVYFKIVPASKRVILWNSLTSLYGKDSATWKTTKKIPAGTYYIQVYRSSVTNASGCYSIKWK